MFSFSPIKSFFKNFRKISEIGIMGINERNGEYILPHNKRSLYPLVDDKIITKKLASDAGLNVPLLYGVISNQHGIKNLESIIAEKDSFVIKPAHGSGGNGILVIANRYAGRFSKPDGELLDMDALSYHCSNVISGMHSLGGQPDKAIIEYCVQFDPIFSSISYQGVPDIRIIVFRGVPAMSMIRLPTRESGGKANLHQGAMAAGIDFATGKTIHAVWKNKSVTEHPDTHANVIGFTIPHWDVLLRQAAQCTDMTGLGYVGVDLVLDKDLGPLVLELNARPGLSIQTANLVGLIPRLKHIEKNYENLHTLDERVNFAKENFAHTARI